MVSHRRKAGDSFDRRRVGTHSDEKVYVGTHVNLGLVRSRRGVGIKTNTVNGGLYKWKIMTLEYVWRDSFRKVRRSEGRPVVFSVQSLSTTVSSGCFVRVRNPCRATKDTIGRP